MTFGLVPGFCSLCVLLLQPAELQVLGEEYLKVFFFGYHLEFLQVSPHGVAVLSVVVSAVHNLTLLNIEG